MEHNIKALSFTKVPVGRRIKKSKNRLTWLLSLDKKEHTIDLYDSKMSGKRKLLVDGEIQYESKKKHEPLFQYNFMIEEHRLVVLEQGKHYELRINSVNFDNLQMAQRSRNHFSYEDKEPSFSPVEIKEDPVSHIEREEPSKNEVFNKNPNPLLDLELAEAKESNLQTIQSPREQIAQNTQNSNKQNTQTPNVQHTQVSNLQTTQITQFQTKQTPQNTQLPIPTHVFGTTRPASSTVFDMPAISCTQKTQIQEDLFEDPSRPQNTNNFDPFANFNTNQVPKSTNPFDF